MQSPLPFPATFGVPLVDVRRSARRTRTMTAYREGDTIVVLIPARLTKAEEARHVPALVQRVLAKEEKKLPPRGEAELAARARRLATAYLVPQAGPLTLPSDVLWVANQNTRWGSCTPQTGVIRLSDRLQAMPAWVVDYVLLHELTHLVERDHSTRFWGLLAAYPDTQRAKGYLDGFADAMRLGVSPGRRS